MKQKDKPSSSPIPGEGTKILEQSSDDDKHQQPPQLPFLEKRFPCAVHKYKFEVTDTDGNLLGKVEKRLLTKLRMSPIYRCENKLNLVRWSRKPPKSCFGRFKVSIYNLVIDEEKSDENTLIVRHKVFGAIAPMYMRHDKFVCTKIDEETGLGLVWEGPGYVNRSFTRLLTCCRSGETEYRQRLVLIDEDEEPKEELLCPLY